MRAKRKAWCYSLAGKKGSECIWAVNGQRKTRLISSSLLSSLLSSSHFRSVFWLPSDHFRPLLRDNRSGRRANPIATWTSDNGLQTHKGDCSGWAPPLLRFRICEQRTFLMKWWEIHHVGEHVLGYCLQTSHIDITVRWTHWGRVSV